MKATKYEIAVVRTRRNLTALEEMCRGYKVADVIIILGSLDIVLGEVDR